MATKKTIHELVKEFPEASYRELEIYRDADRQEEAQRITTQQENEELKENQLTESERKQEELEPIKKEIWQEVWKARYEKEYKLRQEAIELFNACHAKAIQLEEELKKLKKKIDPKHITQKARESGL